jgi:hypothetical protein
MLFEACALVERVKHVWRVVFSHGGATPYLASARQWRPLSSARRVCLMLCRAATEEVWT